MIYTISDFCRYVEQDVNGFMDKLSEETRVANDYEKIQLSQSYKQVSIMLTQARKQNPKIAEAHIGAMTKNLLLEYQLPASSHTCDLVLLGKGKGSYQVYVIELKNFKFSKNDEPGFAEGLMKHNGHFINHPSEQVKGYCKYMERFHETVVDKKAKVAGCAYITQKSDLQPYTQYPNNILITEYPIYNSDSTDSLAYDIANTIMEGDEEFANWFVNGKYKQDRNILVQIAKKIEKGKDSVEAPFELLGEQRAGFKLAMQLVSDCLEKKINHTEDDKKHVIVVKGAPGSGKSAVAINLWVEAVIKYNDKLRDESDSNIVFVTTSGVQSDNWTQIFRETSKDKYGSNVIFRANAFNPGMSGQNMKAKYYPIFAAMDEKYIADEEKKSLKYEYFREYTDYIIKHGNPHGYQDNLHLLSVVDEAHALINPLVKNYSAVGKGGWCNQMGPQAWHIIRESRISVFFMDEVQSYRDQETTKIDDIKAYAKEFDAKYEEITLTGQFRCSGSLDYIKWVDNLFSYQPERNHEDWNDEFEVKVFDYPSDVEEYLRSKYKEGNSVRLTSSYSVKWNSKTDTYETSLNKDHVNLDKVAFDFDLPDREGKRYHNYWNYTGMGSDTQYSWFVQAPQGCYMHENPLAEVGYPLTVRGFEYGYVGVLWLDDIVWRKGKWVINLNNCFEKDTASTRKKAVDEEKDARREFNRRRASWQMRKSLNVTSIEIPKDATSKPQAQELLNVIAMSYRILMTRGSKGVCLYIKDEETRKYVRSLLSIE